MPSAILLNVKAAPSCCMPGGICCPRAASGRSDAKASSSAARRTWPFIYGLRKSSSGFDLVVGQILDHAHQRRVVLAAEPLPHHRQEELVDQRGEREHD